MQKSVLYTGEKKEKNSSNSNLKTYEQARSFFDPANTQSSSEEYLKEKRHTFIDSRKEIIPQPFCVQINHGRYLEEGRNCMSLPSDYPSNSDVVISTKHQSMPELKPVKNVTSSVDSGISAGTSTSSDVSMDSARSDYRRLQSYHRSDGGTSGTIPRSSAMRDGPRGMGPRETAKGVILGQSGAEADPNEGTSSGTRQPPPKKKKPKRNPKKKK